MSAPRIPGHDHLVTLLGVLPPADSAEEAAPEAAVSVCLAPDPHGAATVLLIKRAEHPLDPWSGHIGLPGGRRETDDLDVLATARRETHEEVGLLDDNELPDPLELLQKKRARTHRRAVVHLLIGARSPG